MEVDNCHRVCLSIQIEGSGTHKEDLSQSETIPKLFSHQTSLSTEEPAYQSDEFDQIYLAIEINLGLPS